jgi:hypothetical protein
MAHRLSEIQWFSTFPNRVSHISPLEHTQSLQVLFGPFCLYLNYAPQGLYLKRVASSRKGNCNSPTIGVDISVVAAALPDQVKPISL